MKGTSTRDDDWFEAMYRRSAPAVMAYARRRLPDPQDCEDVVVEVFAVAWRRRATVPDEDLPWLYATAANIIAHTMRGRDRRGRLDAKLASRAGDLTLVGQDSLPESLELAEAMATLSDADQEVLRLWAWEDLDGPGLARALGCSPGSARTRLHRAKTRLRTALADTRKEGTA